MNPDDVRRSLLIVWLVVGSVVAVVLTTPFVVQEESVLHLSPTCEWQARYDRPCVLCGMTRAFLAISRGRLDEARTANRASVPLWLGLLVNESVLAGFLSARLVRAGRRRLRRPGGGRPGRAGPLAARKEMKLCRS
jgi:hypothetical protein